MCDACGCTPCTECGAPVEDGVCSGCGEKPGNCTCEPLEEELAFEEEDYEDETKISRMKTRTKKRTKKKKRRKKRKRKKRRTKRIGSA